MAGIAWQAIRTALHLNREASGGSVRLILGISLVALSGVLRNFVASSRLLFAYGRREHRAFVRQGVHAVT